MLTALSIRNIVLIEALDLDFAGGLGVLTGETGAGKSILLDALGLVLGARADGGLIRAGEDRASVTATFEFASLPAAVVAVLGEAVEIEPGEPLILKRQLRLDGASKGFVNDQPVGAGLLRELAPLLVEIHGQHDDRGLVNPRGHRLLLDRYAAAGGNGADVAGVENAWRIWASAVQALETARSRVARAAEDRDLLRRNWPAPGQTCKKASGCRVIWRNCSICGRGRIRRWRPCAARRGGWTGLPGSIRCWPRPWRRWTGR